MKENESRGITLIALVVTIIILLILAGVSISVLTGENGILKRSTEAKEQTRISEAREELDLVETEWNIERETNQNANLPTFLEDKKTEQNIDDYVDLQDGSYLVQRKNQETILEPATSRPQVWDGTTASAGLLGSGTVEDPFLIRNGADLKFLANVVSNKSTYTLEGQTKGYQYACYRQVKDVYLNDSSNFAQWENTSVQTNLNSFLPIGYVDGTYQDSTFYGKYDGGNYKIVGLYINSPDKDRTALFSTAYAEYDETKKQVNTEICNINLQDAFVKGKYYTGGIIGCASFSNENSTIKNCKVSGIIHGEMMVRGNMWRGR